MVISQILFDSKKPGTKKYILHDTFIQISRTYTTNFW